VLGCRGSRRRYCLISKSPFCNCCPGTKNLLEQHTNAIGAQGWAGGLDLSVESGRNLVFDSYQYGSFGVCGNDVDDLQHTWLVHLSVLQASPAHNVPGLF
jgi:hypothetical protein